ncbi:MAG: hypothetical protein Q8O67_30470 [Deltaproteobacteria bacterium]|nr:hypothetical protein [Deltaproteobacteria bacterium]
MRDQLPSCVALLLVLGLLGACAPGPAPPLNEPYARFAVGVVPHFDVRLLALMTDGTEAHEDFVSVDGRPPRCEVMSFEAGPVLELRGEELHTARPGAFIGSCGNREYEFEAVNVNHVEIVARPIDGTSYDTQRAVMETPTGYLLDATRPEERVELTLRPYDALGRKVIAAGRYGRVWTVPRSCADVVAVLDEKTDPTSTNQLGLAPRAPGTCIVTANYFGKTITKAVTVRCSEQGPGCPTATTATTTTTTTP